MDVEAEAIMAAAASRVVLAFEGDEACLILSMLGLDTVTS